MINKVYILASFVVFSLLSGQVNFPKSPESTLLNKFDTVPVSDYTGVKVFEIPIYTISESGVDIPISLKYHASGVMVEDISGKFGLGWVLNFGDITLGYQKFGKEDTQIWVPTTQEIGNLNEPYTNSNQFAFHSTSTMYPDDSQPDIFSYSTLKSKGKFILNNKSPRFFPPSSVILDVAFLNSALQYPNSLRNLSPSLLDSDGTRYIFDNPIINSGNSGLSPVAGGTYNSINWEIDQIKLSNGREISFNYESNNYSFIANVSRQIEISPYPQSANYLSVCPVNSPLFEQINQTSVEDKMIKEIIFPQGKMIFIYNDKNTEARQDIADSFNLKEIKVFDKNNRLLKILTFSYIYSVSDDSAPNLSVSLSQADNNSITGRLLLKSVTDSSTGQYSIDYYNENGANPNRLSFSKDHWGLYNGKDNTTDIPKTIINGSQYGSADKNADINFAKQFSIKSILYPTGAKHSIDYSLNDYHVNGNVVKDTLFTKALEHNGGFTGMSKNFNFEIDVKENYHITFNCSFPQFTNPDQVIQGENYAVYFVELYKGNQLILSTTSHYNIFENELTAGMYTLKVYKTVHYNETSNLHFDFFLTANHTYEQLFTGNLNSGGIRVSSYKVYENDQLATELEYDYKIPGTNKSSGISYPLYLSSILLSTYPRKIAGGPFGEIYPNFDEYCSRYTISNNNNGINVNLIGRSSVGYSYVNEIKRSANSQQYSILRKYVNHYADNSELVQDPNEIVDIPSFSLIYDLTVPQFIPTENGTLLREIYINDAGVTVKESEFEYEFDTFYNQSSNGDLPNKYVFSGWLFSRKMYLNVPGEITWGGGSVPAENATEMYNLWHMFKYNSARYLIPANWTRLKSLTSIEYFNGNSIVEKSYYDYDEQYKHFNPILISHDFKNKISQTTYSYAHEKGNQYLISKNMIGIPLETSVIKKTDSTATGKLISKSAVLFPTSQTEADQKTSGLALPYETQSAFANAPLATDVTYDKYDDKGNIVQFTSKDGIPTTIVWGYNKTQPIAKIAGAAYSAVSSAISTIVDASNTDASNPSTEPALISALDSFRKESDFSGYQITTYTYDPLIGVTSITPPSGIREVYLYDNANRLKEIRENNATGKVIKEFKYNYKQ